MLGTYHTLLLTTAKRKPFAANLRLVAKGQLVKILVERTCVNDLVIDSLAEKRISNDVVAYRAILHDLLIADSSNGDVVLTIIQGDC